MSWKPLDPPFELSEPKFSSQNQRRPRARSSPPAMNSPQSSALPALANIFQTTILRGSELAEDRENYITKLIMASTGALDYFNSLDLFLDYCRQFFVPDYLARISKYYRGLETDISSLACTATHGSIAASLITDAFLSLNKLSDSVEATDANEGWAAAVVGKGGKGFFAGGGSGKPGGGDDRDHGEQREGGRGNRRGGRGDRGRGGGRGRGGRDPSSTEEPEEEEEEEDMFFREVRRSIIKAAMFATPPKDVPDRLNSAQEIASRLSSNSTIDRLSRNAYDPFEDDEGMDADTRRVLFHGTRHSTLPSFTSLGIQPPARRSTLSRGPAFYTTTDARIAYLHAILHHPRISSQDPIIFIILKISPPILHGSRPFPSFSPLEHRWFRAETEEETEQLLLHGQSCMSSRRFRPLSNQADVVIAPHLVPQSDQTVYIPRYTFIGTGAQPTQVAAATQAAWAYFAASVDEILIEERVAEAAEE